MTEAAALGKGHGYTADAWLRELARLLVAAQRMTQAGAAIVTPAPASPREGRSNARRPAD